MTDAMSPIQKTRIATPLQTAQVGEARGTVCTPTDLPGAVLTMSGTHACATDRSCRCECRLRRMLTSECKQGAHAWAYPSAQLKEVTLVWWIVGVVAGLALLGIAMWVLGPTLKTFLGPGFEPTYKDDASVEKAQQSGPASGTGAGGGGM